MEPPITEADAGIGAFSSFFESFFVFMKMFDKHGFKIFMLATSCYLLLEGIYVCFCKIVSILWKKRKGFNDMPIGIVDKILNNLDDSIEKIRMRRVCSGFRDVIDDQMSRCKTVSIVFSEDSFHLGVDEMTFVYVSNVDHWSFYKELRINGHTFVQDKGTLTKKALSHMKYLLKNPRVQLNEFIVVDISTRPEESEAASELESILKTLDHKIHTKSVHFPITAPKNHIRLLRNLKPGVLEKISLLIKDEDVKKELFVDLYETEQWKLAIDRKIEVDLSGDLSKIIDLFRQATSITIRRPKFIPEEIVQIREILFESPNFKNGAIGSNEVRASIKFASIKEALGACTADPNDPERCFYPIPDSNEFLEFEFPKDKTHIPIRKVKNLSIAH